MTVEPPYEKHTHMLIAMGRHRQALLVALKWVEAKPDIADAWFCRSACELAISKPDLALVSVDKALQLDPDNSRNLAHRARCLVGVGKTMSGLEIARKLAAKEQDNPQLLDALATTMSEAGEPAEAIPVLEQAISINAGIAQYHTNYGTTLHFCRRTDEAEVAYLRGLELKPDDFHGYWLLSRLRKATTEKNFLERFHRVLDQHQDKLIARVSINYALGDQYEDLNQFDEAFKHYQRGAEATLEHTPYHEESTNELLDAYRREFDVNSFASEPAGYDNDEAILIVGMPRSGTTLVERIIASYDDVFAAGELHNFTHLLTERCSELNPGKRGVDILTGAASLDFAELGQSYIESTRPRTGHTRFFIDKYPFNFQIAGAMAKALPKAKFINLVRNPMDTCFSNFKLLFKLGSAMYSYDMKTLADFYAQYQEMMSHWHKCMPGRILDVHYEALVQNPEKEVRRITDFLTLDWDPKCLEFYKSSEAVTTASTGQIRQPINASSLYKWKEFEHHLEPLKAALLKHRIDVS